MNILLTPKEILVPKPGEDISYLTDFIYEDISFQNVIGLINNCQTVVCESQYGKTDKALAEKNFHLTSILAAELAKKSGVKKLILFHISDRYRIEDYQQILTEAKSIFPQTYFPEDWKICLLISSIFLEELVPGIRELKGELNHLEC
jgi:ribonuclease Z